jgi:hypothetical protein
MDIDMGAIISAAKASNDGSATSPRGRASTPRRVSKVAEERDAICMLEKAIAMNHQTQGVLTMTAGFYT